MSDTDHIIASLDEQAKVMLKWATIHQKIKMSATQAVYQKAAETMLDAAEHMRQLDDRYQTAHRGHTIYRTVANDLNNELDRIEQRSISYNLVRAFRIIRNFYK